MKTTKELFNKRLVLLTLISTFFLIILSSTNVYAHSPSEMSLTYNSTTHDLQISVTHQVSNPDTHYVFRINIKINNETYANREYSNQPGSSFTYTFEELEVIEGDTIEVTAYCNQGGYLTKQLTIGSGEISKVNGEEESTPGFELILFIISIIISIIIIQKKR